MKKILLSALFCGFVLNNGYCVNGEHKITEDNIAPIGVVDALKDRLVGMSNAQSCTKNNKNDISENGIPQTQPFVQPSLLERNFQCNYGSQQTSYFNTVPFNAVLGNVFQSNCMPQVPNWGYVPYIPENGIPYSAPQQMPSFNYGNTIQENGFVSKRQKTCPEEKLLTMDTSYEKGSCDFESVLSEKFKKVNEIIYKNPERMYMFVDAYGHSIRKAILDDLFKYFASASRLLEIVHNMQYEKKSLELRISMDKNKDSDYTLVMDKLEMKEKLSAFCRNYLIFYIQQIDLCIYYLRSF